MTNLRRECCENLIKSGVADIDLETYEVLCEKAANYFRIAKAYDRLAKAIEKQGQAKTERLQKQIGYEMTKLKATRNELQGEEMLKDILVVAAERTVTKED